MNARGVRLVLVMARDAAEASVIGRTLVEERLAACANLIAPVRSIYRWRGTIEDAEETLLLLKTRARLYAQLERRVRELHSYEVPEIIALPLASGAAAYLSWVLDSAPARGRRQRKKSMQDD